MFARLSAFYGRSFERHPWLTLAVTNGALSVVADACAQGFELVAAREAPGPAATAADVPAGSSEDKSLASTGTALPHPAAGFDVVRSARFLGFGMLMAPPLDAWNKMLENRFPITQGSVVRLPLLLRRVVVDQSIFGPFSVAAFIGVISVLEGQGATDIRHKYRSMFTEALLANWQVWPVVQLVNFRFMPLKYRVPFMSTCGVFWTIYLSLLNMARSGSVPQIEREAGLFHS